MEKYARCLKPDCDCLEIAIEKNEGTDVKSYPCLAGSNTPMPSYFKVSKKDKINLLKKIIESGLAIDRADIKNNQI